jgi:transposase
MSDTELLPKSKPQLEPVRRLEVFTGSGRRRAWTAEQKARIVAETYESGETVSAIARRHGLTPQQLFGWRRHGRPSAQQRSGDNSVAFAPVVVETGRPGARTGTVPGRLAIEIVIGAATVRVPPGVDGATLQTVLRAVSTVT